MKAADITSPWQMPSPVVLCTGTYQEGKNKVTTDLSHLKDGNYVLTRVTIEFSKTRRIRSQK